MGVTTDIPKGWGLLRLRGVDPKATAVSRMQCMQAAVDIQLEELYKQYPRKRVVLITFSTQVSIIGDGTKDEKMKTINGSLLHNYDNLILEGQQLIVDTIKPIYKSKNALSAKVFELKQTGSTALGPALAVAVGIASQQASSEIIVCTDGTSNIGVGMTGMDDEHYKKLGSLAARNGSTISVIGIEGTDCGVDSLSKAADESGGVVNVVNPLELQRQMRMIIDNPVLAMSAKVTCILPPFLAFKNETNCKKNMNNIVTVDVGNVTVDTDLSFQFGIQDKDILSTQITRIPIQLQVWYTTPDSSEFMRVVSVNKTVRSRDDAESAIDVSVLAVSGVQLSAKLAQAGHPGEARASLFSVQRLLQKTARTDIQREEYSNFIERCEDLDTVLQNMQRVGGKIDDATTKVLHLMRHATHTDFLSGSRKENIVKRRKNHTKSRMANIPISTNNDSDTDDDSDEKHSTAKGKGKQKLIDIVVGDPNVKDEKIMDELKQAELEKQKLEEELKKKEEEKLCVICEDKAINVVLVPCGHQILCMECSEKQQTKGDDKCPACRGTITMRIKTFGK